jgi:hypothetical protein
MTLGVVKGTEIPQELRNVFSAAGIGIEEFVSQKTEKLIVAPPPMCDCVEDGIEIKIEGMD